MTVARSKAKSLRLTESPAFSYFLQMLITFYIRKGEEKWIILSFAAEIARDTWEYYNCGHPDDAEVDAALRFIAEREVKIQDKNAEHGWVISQDDIEYDVRGEVRELSEKKPELFN